MTTNTPRGASASSSASAICVVSRSWTWGRFAEHVDDPRDLRQTGDPPVLVRDVRDVRLPAERQQVVFAQRLQRDVADHDHLVEVRALDDGDERRGVDADAREDLARTSRRRAGRVTHALALGILADPLEDQPDALLRPSRRRTGLHPCGPDATRRPGTRSSSVSGSPARSISSRRARQFARLAEPVDPHGRQPELAARRDVVEQRCRHVDVPRPVGAGPLEECAPSARAPACTSRPRTPRPQVDRHADRLERGVEEVGVGVRQDPEPPPARAQLARARPAPRRTDGHDGSDSPSASSRSSPGARAPRRARPARATRPAPAGRRSPRPRCTSGSTSW